MPPSTRRSNTRPISRGLPVERAITPRASPRSWRSGRLRSRGNSDPGRVIGRRDVLERAAGFIVGWPLVVALAGYVLWTTVDWEVPQPGAIRFGPLWVATVLACAAAWIMSGRRLTPIAALAI